VTAADTRSQRIDKWLFFARIAKSRSLAAKAVTQGHVRLNREKVTKPSTEVSPGDVVTVVIHGHVRVVKVLAPGERRGPASEAALLFEDRGASQKHVSKP
jgi:ribosome-associated heat shock protein Hsp15